VKLLALDSATDACTVAVWMNGTVHERFEVGTRHSKRILTLIDEVLAEAGIALTDLDVIAFGRGPGSFTGLRISAGVAQGLAFGADLPVVAVSSLAALADDVEGDRVLAAFDARMQQVYWGAYVRNAEGLMELQAEEVVVAPTEVPIPSSAGWIGAGSGWDQYADTLQARLGNCVTQWHRGRYPRARSIARLGAAGFEAGKAVAPEQALPIYIRDDVAKKTSTR
jgi:tRNA threonylcarbamoyladenosine biosynthesis protein TsaB